MNPTESNNACGQQKMESLPLLRLVMLAGWCAAFNFPLSAMSQNFALQHRLPPEIAQLDNSNDGNLKVSIEVEAKSRIFRKGDHIRYILRTTSPAYVSLLSFQSDGSWLMLFPNRFEKDTWIDATKPRLIPNPELNQYDFIVDAPYGTDIVCALACSTQQELSFKLQQLMQQKTHYVALDRGILPMEKTQPLLSSNQTEWDIDWVKIVTSETGTRFPLPILSKPISFIVIGIGLLLMIAALFPLKIWNRRHPDVVSQ